MSGDQSNVVALLPELTWRGLKPVPVAEVSYDFAHDQAERRYPYLDGAGHDWTGRGPIKFSAKLLFINGIEGRKDLYPHTWENWRNALFEGSAGDLVHPELGTVRARPLSGSIRIGAESRAGVTAEVTWTETIDSPDKEEADFTKLSISLPEAAALADRACYKIGVPYPKIVDPAMTSLVGAINSIEGQFFSASLKVTGAINQVIGGVRQMSDALDFFNPNTSNLATPYNVWPARYALGLVEQGLLELRERAQKSARPTASVTLETSTTLDAFARKVGNDVGDLIELNVYALGKPSVSAGMVLRYYVGT